MSVISPAKPQISSHNFKFVRSQYAVSFGQLLQKVGFHAESHTDSKFWLYAWRLHWCVSPAKDLLALTPGWIAERTKSKRSGSLIWNPLPKYYFVLYVVEGPLSHSPLSLGAAFYFGSGVGRHQVKDSRTWANFAIYKKKKEALSICGFSSSS